MKCVGQLPIGNTEEKQKQYVDKYSTLYFLELCDGLMWRKTHSNEPAKYITCTYEIYERIKTTHLELGHVGIKLLELVRSESINRNVEKCNET